MTSAKTIILHGNGNLFEVEVLKQTPTRVTVALPPGRHYTHRLPTVDTFSEGTMVLRRNESLMAYFGPGGADYSTYFATFRDVES